MAKKTIYKGVGGSPGKVTAEVINLKTPDYKVSTEGKILVCPITDPTWMPLLRNVSGVVTEIGGILSHPAIVAREIGIPAVVAVPRITSKLPTGTVITIDGGKGEIHVQPK